jgi:hypothetical protein
MANTVDTLLVEIRAETAQLRKGLDKVNKQLDKTKKQSSAATNALKGFGAIVATLGLGRLVGETINTIRTFEDLEATLTAITGSAKTAALSFDLIREFTSKTTFQLEGVAEAFISLLQAGVTPTEEALSDFGNLAAAFGKDISQVAQATFRAVTGEMEMLKQFNVVAKLEGDKVRVTFGGVTKEIERNGTAIAEYLRTLGRENFPTALEDRANTLSGAISNVSDGVAEFMVSIGEGGLKDSLVTIAREMRKVLDEAKPLAEAIGAVLGTAVKIFGTALILVIENFKILLSLIMAKAFSMLPAAFIATTTAVKGLNISLATTNLQLARMTKFLKASKLTVLLAGIGLLTVPLYNWATAEEEVNEELDETIDKSEQLTKALAKPIPFMDRLGKSTKDTLKFLQEFGLIAKTTDQKVREFSNGGLADLEKMVSSFTAEKFEIAFNGFIGPIDDKVIKQFNKDMRDSFFKEQFGTDEDTVMKRIGLMPVGDLQAAVKDVQSVINKELDPDGINIYKELLKDENKLADFFELAGGSAAFFGKSLEEIKPIMEEFVNATEEVGTTMSDTLKDAITESAHAFSNELSQALVSGQASLETFKDFAKNITSQIIAIFMQMAVVNKILNVIFGAGTFDELDFKTGKIVKATESAGGGTIQGGRPSLVGERGPEIFVPNTGGTIMNNMNSKNAVGGGTPINIYQNVNFATGVVSTVRAEVTKMMPQIADVTKAAVQESAMRGGNFRRSLVGG